mgnify:CR=1 FL=1
MLIVRGYSQFCSQWSQILPEIFMHDTGGAMPGFESSVWNIFDSKPSCGTLARKIRTCWNFANIIISCKI